MKTTNSFTSFYLQNSEENNRIDLSQGIMKRLLKKYNINEDVVKVKIDDKNSRAGK